VGTLRFSVAEAEAGSRLDAVLATRREIATRALAERLLRDGAVRVDGTERPKSHRLAAGALVEVDLPAPAPGLVPAPVSVSVLYEDDDVLVVDKPAGISVHPGAGEKQGTLAGQLLTLGAAGGPGRSSAATWRSFAGTRARVRGESTHRWGATGETPRGARSTPTSRGTR
jgi:23S rRNA pseudouridine1911/1915/1917 synthase